MTAHGAYTKLISAVHKIRDCARDTAHNVKTLNVAYPLPDDPALIQTMNEMAEYVFSLAQALAEIRKRSVTVAEQYLKANRHRIKKAYTLKEGATYHGRAIR